MTKINKIVMHGFKSFAQHTELVFGNKFNCILGPNGSGKSARGDTEVLLSNGELKPIADLVDSALDHAHAIPMDDGVYTLENPFNIKVLGLKTDSFKVVEKDVSAFIRREGELYLYEIITASGKKVATTGCHPVMIFKDNKVQSELVRNLNENQLIATPRKIEFQNKSIIKFHDKALNKEMARFVGYLIGDGYIRRDRFELVNEEDELIADFKSALNAVFQASPKYEKKSGKVTRLISWDKCIAQFLFSLFKAKEGISSLTSLHKAIPSSFLVSPDDVISNLLAALFDCDGYVSKSVPQIEFTNKNEKLVDQIQLLLLRFGIVSIKKEKYRTATNTEKKLKQKYFFLYIYGKENLSLFYENIPLKSMAKKKKLRAWVEKNTQSNPNLDVLPQEINGLVKKTKETLLIDYKPLRKKFPSFAAYIENRCNPTREGIRKALSIFYEKINAMKTVKRDLKLSQAFLTSSLRSIGFSNQYVADKIGISRHSITDFWEKNIFNARPKNLMKLYDFIKNEIDVRLNEAAELTAFLEGFSCSDIFWDRIVSIKKVEGEKWVYDLTIPNCHNFIGNGIFVHNSNILDALCFVLGEMSSKSLRAKKSSDFIYNGGETKKGASSAEVSIYFDNGNKIFPSNDKEIKITRIVKQNGQGRYKINDKTMTRQQIIDLLNIARIDPDGYNIILQGDIIRFTEMPSEERRKVIEEVAGISVYEDKKHKAELELQKVDSKLGEANILLKEREANLKELKKDRDQALRYKELNDKIRQNKATYINIQMQKESKKKEELEQKIEKHKLKAEGLRKNISDLKNDIIAKREEIGKITEEVEKRGYKDSLDAEIQQLRVDIETNKNKITGFEAEISRVMQRKEGLQSNLAQTEEKIESLNKEKLDLENEKAKKLKELEALNKKSDDFKKKNKLGKDADDIEKEIETIDKGLEEKQSKIQQLIKDQQALLRQKDMLEYSIRQIEESVKKVEEIEKEHRKEIADLKKKKEELKKAANELSQLLNEDSSLAVQLSNSREKLTKLIEELTKLEARSVGSQERFFGNMAVKKVLENKNKLGEIYGTVGQLGKVNSKYALALEIAAGPKIDALVVEDDKTAAKCIKYLKENKFGVATFFPLNKIKPTPIKPEIEKLKPSNGVHDLAVNLVSYQQKFRDVFSHVFANTLVVGDIDVARRIGIGTVKMVTIDGDLTELSGAMHGGFRHRTKGIGFEEEDIAKDIEDKTKEMTGLKGFVSTLEKRRKDVDDKIVSLRNFKANIEGDIIKAEKGLHLEDFDLDATKNKKDAFIEESREAGKKIAAVDEEISAVNKAIAQDKTRKQELKNKISELKDPKILAELNAFEETKKGMDAAVMGMILQAKNIDDQVQSIHLRDKENTVKILKQADKEIEGFKKQITDLKDRIKNQSSSLKEKESKQNEFYSKFEALYKKRNRLNDEILNDDAKADSLSHNLREIEQIMNTFSIDEAAIKAKLVGLEEEFSQYEGVKLASGKSEEELKKEIGDFEKMRDNIGSVNMRALEIYGEIEKQFNELIEKKDKLDVEKEDVLNMMAEIEGRKKDLFMNTMTTVNEHFRRIFSLLLNKGDAFLDLENKEDPFAGGVRIKAKLTGNKFLDILSLSGGEKTLTALAFIFSIQEHQPASFYILDEVDAALDKHNSEKFAKLIAQYSEKAQYLLISHNDQIISEADTLYGVTMDKRNNVSKVVSIKI